MSESTEDNQRVGEAYEGWGDSLEKAFENCATAAIRANADNNGAVFQVVRYEVKVSNPNISEHKVTIAR